MHFVLGWKSWLSGALFLCASLVGLRVSQDVELFKAVQQGASLTGLLTTAFVTTPAWRLLWLLPYFRDRAPTLDGEWTGVVSSNWSIVDAMRNAARQDGSPAFDADVVGGLPPLTTVAVRARIRSSFFGITIELETIDDRYQTSSLKVVELRPGADGPGASLHYIFESRVLQPKPGDVSCFEGASSLAIRTDEKVRIMEGPTWTNRAWSRGLNTAGVIRLRRVAPSFWSPLTLGLLKR